MAPDHRTRTALLGDRPSILTLVQLAFATGGRDGGEEVDIVKTTWALGAAAEGLELVAVVHGVVVGHVLGARGDLAGRDVVGVAPLAVSSAHQRAGVGSALMRELISRAEASGWPLLVLLGSPAYYSRFGFEPSWPLDISYGPVGPNDPHFQVRRLSAYAPTIRGQFTYCWERSNTE